MTRVLILEPDGWRFRGLCSVLKDSGEFDVVGDPDYGHFVSMTKRPDDLTVDVIVIAHRLVLEYGLAIIPMLRDMFDPCNVLVHGEIDSLDVAAQMYTSGARGYFTLGSPPGQLIKAVKVVSNGKIWGPREAIVMMADRVRSDHPANGSDNEVDPADRELLQLLNEGLSNKEIGQRLGLAEATIKARLNRLYKQFNVASRLQLLSAAIRDGLVTPR